MGSVKPVNIKNPCISAEISTLARPPDTTAAPVQVLTSGSSAGVADAVLLPGRRVGVGAAPDSIACISGLEGRCTAADAQGIATADRDRDSAG